LHQVPDCWSQKGSPMKKLLLTSIAALFLATGTAHADESKTIRQQCESELLGHTTSKADRAQELADIEECVRDRSPKPQPAPARFRPWQMAWQCNDLRVTVTGQGPNTVNYDIAGTIWGGINFTQTFDLREGNRLFLRGVPCVPLS